MRAFDPEHDRRVPAGLIGGAAPLHGDTACRLSFGGVPLPLGVFAALFRRLAGDDLGDAGAAHLVSRSQGWAKR